MENKKERVLFSCVIYLSLMGSALICACLNHMTWMAAAARTGYALILGGIFLMLLHGREDFLWKQIASKAGYLVIFAFCVCLIGVASRYSVGVLWMLLLIVVGYQKEQELKVFTFGMLMAVYLCNALMVHQQIGLLEYYLVMGIALLLILSLVHKKEEIPYAGVILLTLCLALLIFQNKFDFRAMWQNRFAVVLEIGSLVFLLLVCVMLIMWQEGETIDTVSERTVLENGLFGFLQDDFELLQQLKENEELYHHSYEISRVSTLAAREIGCDSMLAGVGGMYHEAGRLLDQNNYMEANRVLAEKYQFPVSLQDVIRQHNTGSEVPKSREAAIVMLSDCILSTSEYLEKSGKRAVISDEKLVKSIFSNRLAKGSLKESGLSQEEIHQLEEFYISHAFTAC